MTHPDEIDFSLPNRQSPVAILLILFRLFRFLFRQFWPVLLVFFIQPKRATLFGLIWLGVILAFLSTVNSIFSYFYSVYYVSEGELILETGWLRRTRLSVPLDRIQTISFQQTFLHRLFNTVSVEIDTAGSKGAEFSLHAIQHKQAHALRDFLLRQRAEEIPGALEEPTSIQRKVLLQLGVFDLFKIGISQNHLRTAGILTAVGLGFLDDLESVLGEAVYKDWEKTVGGYFDALWWLTLAFVVILLILSFFGTLILTAIRNYDLQFIQTGQGFHVEAGLFAKREQSANFRKIQFIRWTAHPIQRWLGMFSLRLYQAAGYALNKQKTIQVPGCYWSQLETVQRVYFPEATHEGDWEWHELSPHFFSRRFLFLGIFPAIGGIGLSLLLREYQFLPIFLLWGPCAFFWQRRLFRTFFVGLHPEGLQVQEGFFTRTTTYLRWQKTQGISLKQTPYQQNHAVANLVLHTASGDIKLPYLPIGKARSIRDYVLFQVEKKKD